MKKVIFGLLVVCAMGASAFTSAPSKARFASFFYVLQSDGLYHRVTGQPSESGCLNQAEPKCVIGFDSNPGDETYSPDDLPSTPTYTSSTKGIWTAPPAK